LIPFEEVHTSPPILEYVILGAKKPWARGMMRKVGVE
jgi:hypothetical protein